LTGRARSHNLKCALNVTALRCAHDAGTTNFRRLAHINRAAAGKKFHLTGRENHMAWEYPPFLNSYGVIPLILAKIQTAPIPARFSHEFMAGTLGFQREADRPFIPLAKRMGLLAADGTPTDLYKRFRNPGQSQPVLAEALGNAFAQLYSRSAEVDALDKKALRNLVADLTGLEPSHPSARAIVGTFLALKNYAAPGEGGHEMPSRTKTRRAPASPREYRAGYFGIPLLQK
jgi:Family of unknown function (DUF5343)